jgi:hypothetical protein
MAHSDWIPAREQDLVDLCEKWATTLADTAKQTDGMRKRMDDSAKLVLGIRPADTTPTTHEKPTSQPDTVVENTVNHFEHRLRALNDASKPADTYGVRYAWQIGGEKPASDEDLPKSKFSRKTSFIVPTRRRTRQRQPTTRPVMKIARAMRGPGRLLRKRLLGKAVKR